MSKIFLYGAPGSGKTTISRFLKLELNYPLVEADYLRENIAQLEKTEKEDPFVYVGTKEAWKYFGNVTKENVLKGLFAVRKSMNPYVTREITLYTNLILEAAFLTPQETREYGTTILFITLNEDQHKKQFFEHREHSSHTQNDHEIFNAVRILQEYFIEEATKEGIKIIENNGNIRELAKTLSSQLQQEE